MSRFSRRSDLTELLDRQDIETDMLHRNLSELDTVNRRLGGHSVSISGLSHFLTDRNRLYHVVDIGCGGGDAMIAMARHARKNGFRVRFTGVDLKADCVSYMNRQCRDYPEISGVVADYRDYLARCGDADIVHASLFCHHLSDQQITDLLRSAQEAASCGIIINDLHRHPVAYYSIWLLTRLLNGSPLVRHDAPVSVLRSFTRTELQELCRRARATDAQIAWRWAFRYRILAHGKKEV